MCIYELNHSFEPTQIKWWYYYIVTTDTTQSIYLYINVTCITSMYISVHLNHRTEHYTHLYTYIVRTRMLSMTLEGVCFHIDTMEIFQRPLQPCILANKHEMHIMNVCTQTVPVHNAHTHIYHYLYAALFDS